MFCQDCGTHIPEDSEFCFKCGIRQNAQANTSNHHHQAQHPATRQTGQVNSIIVWILAFTPIIGAVFAFGTLVFLAINIVFCYIDEYLIRKQGYDTSYMGNTWFVPTYLYKRAKTFGHSLGYFIVWCVTFGLSFLGFL